MKLHVLIVAVGALLSAPAQAGDPLPARHQSKNSICERDFSDIELPVNKSPLGPPEHLEERAIRPGLLHVQKESCRCLPRWRGRQPVEIRAELRIDPNQGKTRVKYDIGSGQSRHLNRMKACLGEPTLTFDAIDYVSDMITEDGPVEEVIEYPLLFTLREESR